MQRHSVTSQKSCTFSILSFVRPLYVAPISVLTHFYKCFLVCISSAYLSIHLFWYILLFRSFVLSSCFLLSFLPSLLPSLVVRSANSSLCARLVFPLPLSTEAALMEMEMFKDDRERNPVGSDSDQKRQCVVTLRLILRFSICGSRLYG